MSHLALTLLGTFEVSIDKIPIDSLRATKARCLMAYLAIEVDHPHSRNSLVALLWPDDDPQSGSKSLRQALYVLRQSLGDTAREQPFLLADRQTIQFNRASHHSVDVIDFLNHMNAGEYAHAVQLYHGDLLAGLDSESATYDEWLVAKREELHQLALSGYRLLGETALARGDYTSAITAARRELAMEPWREGAHVRLMRALVAGGDRASALAQFERCRHVLEQELNAQPSVETKTLYAEILGGQTMSSTAPAKSPTRRDRLDQVGSLVNVPETAAFYGRKQEQELLKRWIVQENVRLIGVLGLGGIGKSSLVAYAARTWLHRTFDFVIWKSLLNAPLLDEVISDIMNALTGDDISAHGTTADQRISQLMHQLRTTRCLLILDNLESILIHTEHSGQPGKFMDGYDAYGQFFEAVTRHVHQSCIIFTSRERPQGGGRLEADFAHVQSIRLRGVDAQAGEALLEARGLASSGSTQRDLIERYSGNPLALKLAAEIIREYFDGDLPAFLAEETLLVNDVRRLLDEQFARLTLTEREVILWLAIQRVPMTVQDLRSKTVWGQSLPDLIEAVSSLVRRSLVEQTDGRVYLQNVVSEYVTDHVIRSFSAEIEAGKPNALTRHGLLDTQAPAYVQMSQKRVFLKPLLRQLKARLGKESIVHELLQLIERFRLEPLPGQRYGPGNILNLLAMARADLRGRDFSALSVRHVDLSDIVLPNVDFTGSNLSDALFTQTFSHLISLSYSPDGRRLAAGSFGAKVYIFDTSTWQVSHILDAHNNWVLALSFSADGKYLASASHDGTIRLWDAISFSEVAVARAADTEVYGLAFHPDGHLLASVGNERVIRVWECENGELSAVKSIQGSTSQPIWHPDGRMLLFGDERTESVVIYDYANDRHVGTLSPYRANVSNNIAVSSDGMYVAAAGPNNSLNIWDLRTFDLLHSLRNGGDVIRIQFAHNNDRVVTSSYDRTVRVWNIKNWTLQHTFAIHQAQVLGLAMHPARNEIVSSANDHTLAMSDIDKLLNVRLLRGYAGQVACVAFSPDDQHIVTGNFWGTLNMWETETQDLSLSLPHVHNRGISCVAFSPDGSMLATGSGFGDGLIKIRHAQTVTPIRDLHIPNVGTHSIVFSPDGALLGTGGSDNVIRIWEVDSGRLVRTLTGHTSIVYCVTFSFDGRYIASAAGDDTIRLWDAQEGAELVTMYGHKKWGRCVDFHSRQPVLASCSDDRTIRLWSVPDAKPLAEFTGHEAQVRWLKFLPDSDLLMSASYDHTLRLWNSTTGEVVRVFEGHTDSVMSVDVTSDGRLAASGGFDETVRLWDVGTGECLAVLRHERPYEGMNVAGASGLTPSQIAMLKELGAVERFQ